VGIATPGLQPGHSDASRRALSAARAGRSHLEQRPSPGTDESTTVVTFDRPLGRRSPGVRSHRVVRSIRRRSLYRYRGGRSSGSSPTQSPSGAPADQFSVVLKRGSVGPTVLVVDPLAPNLGHFGLAATTAASLAERGSCRTALVACSPDDQLPMAVDGVALDLVVLVLGDGMVCCSSAWSSGVWGIAARLTSSYRMAAVPVLAINAGAGAGAVASCAANGAHALSSLDRLPQFLRSLKQSNSDGVRLTAGESLPPQFMALVGLTASERRVLYYLTKGWVAQDIAEYLVVSLTTVRSHIRSVLRKLRVRSQLAAVAIANSSDLENLESGRAS
jgi:DNA-binding NarL/FixJ family response regulator